MTRSQEIRRATPKQRVLAAHPKAKCDRSGPHGYSISAPTMRESHFGLSAKVAWELAAASLEPQQ